MSIEQVKCAKCRVALKGRIVDSKPQGKFICPICGEGDTHENVMREVGDYMQDKAAERMAAAFKKAVRGSKSMTFRENRRPKKRYRFFVDLKAS
jgi:hypothetical protein